MEMPKKKKKKKKRENISIEYIVSKKKRTIKEKTFEVSVFSWRPKKSQSTKYVYIVICNNRNKEEECLILLYLVDLILLIKTRKYTAFAVAAAAAAAVVDNIVLKACVKIWPYLQQQTCNVTAKEKDATKLEIDDRNKRSRQRLI